MPLQRIAARISQLGWVDGLFFFVARGLSILTRRRVRIVRYHLVAQPVPQNGPTMRASPSLQVSFVNAEDPLVQQFPRQPDIIGQRFRAGSRCLAARAGDRFAGFIWLARGGYDEDTVRCRYEFSNPEVSAWDFDVFVEPDFRFGRTFSRLWDTANQQLSSEGVKWSFSRIESSNPDSLLAHRRLGIEKLFSMTFACAGPAQITFTRVSPYIHVSLSPQSRPTIQLPPPSGHHHA